MSFEVWVDARQSGGLPRPWLRKLVDEVPGLVDRVLVGDGDGDDGEIPCAVLRHEATSGRLLDGSGNLVGACLRVSDPASQSEAKAMVGCVEMLCVDFPPVEEAAGAQPCIVAENLISVAEGSPTRVCCAPSSLRRLISSATRAAPAARSDAERAGSRSSDANVSVSSTVSCCATTSSCSTTATRLRRPASHGVPP